MRLFIALIYTSFRRALESWSTIMLNTVTLNIFSKIYSWRNPMTRFQICTLPRRWILGWTILTNSQIKSLDFTKPTHWAVSSRWLCPLDPFNTICSIFEFNRKQIWLFFFPVGQRPSIAAVKLANGKRPTAVFDWLLFRYFTLSSVLKTNFVIRSHR